MMIAGKYLSRSRLFRRLKNGSHGQLIERYAARLVEDGRAQQGTLRCLRIIGGLLSWIAISRSRLTDLDEAMVERIGAMIPTGKVERGERTRTAAEASKAS
jgi:hypothetical protein